MIDPDAPVQPAAPRRPDRTMREPLLRHVLGGLLRERRHRRGDTLGEVARRAGVSPQYLSEVERGRKEPSSEMIRAIAGALDTSLLDLTTEAALVLTATAESDAPVPEGGAAAFALAA